MEEGQKDGKGEGFCKIALESYQMQPASLFRYHPIWAGTTTPF